MSKKRRMFDIDLPEDAGDETFPTGKVENPSRRGPMAAAISETSDSLRERQAMETRIRTENDALAHEYVRLKKLGLVTDLIPLDRIETRKLVRDRTKSDDNELGELIHSIREVGLSNPIRVQPCENDRFELVQGYRRLAAYRSLLEETGDASTYGAIPSGIMARGETLVTLYRRMVDENLVRKDISFYEMAQLAVDYAADPETPEVDPEKAVAVLYQSTGYQKRSYIRTFIKLVNALREFLLFPSEIPRALGLSLAARLDDMPGLARAIRGELSEWDDRSIRDELEVLRRFAGDAALIESGDKGGRQRLRENAKRQTAGPAKTTFQMTRAQGRVRCVAGAGRLEVRLDRDFSTIDRRRLEAAVALMLDQLD